MSTIKKKKHTKKSNKLRKPLEMTRRLAHIITTFKNLRPIANYKPSRETWINDLFDYVHLADKTVKRVDLDEWIKENTWITNCTESRSILSGGDGSFHRGIVFVSSEDATSRGFVHQMQEVPSTSTSTGTPAGPLSQVTQTAVTSPASSNSQDPQTSEEQQQQQHGSPNNNPEAPSTSVTTITPGGPSSQVTVPFPASSYSQNPQTQEEEEQQQEHGPPNSNPMQLTTTALELISALVDSCETLGIPVQAQLRPLLRVFQRRSKRLVIDGEPESLNNNLDEVVLNNLKQEPNDDDDDEI